MEVASAFAVLSAAACAATLRLSYRTLKAPFFLYLLIGGFSLAIAAAASCFKAWPSADALSDMGLAASGMLLAAAASQLFESFRLAGGDYD